MKSRLLLGAVLLLGIPVAAAAAPDGCAPPSSTFDLIQRGIFEQYGCTRSYCHGSRMADGIDLRPTAAYDTLLHHEMDDGDLVVPFRPDRSVLYLSLEAKTNGSTSAVGMPLNGLALTPGELDGVRSWILAGAAADGFVDGVDSLIHVCPNAAPEDQGPPPACAASDRLLLPNLVVDPPSDVQVMYRDGHRLLEFTTAVANIGDGPLVIQAVEAASKPDEVLPAVQVVTRRDGSKCTHPAGVIRFAADGHHWAYTQTVNYELRRDDPYTGDLVALTSKTSYCLLDTDPIQRNQSNPHQFEAHCTDPIGRMGISVGYKDVYHRIHPGQWIDLDDDPEMRVEPGTYYLVNVANPHDVLLEKDARRDSNLNFKAVGVALADLNPPAAAPTPTAPPSVPTIAPSPRQRPVRAPRPDRLPRPTRAARPEVTPRPARTPPVHPSHPPHPSNSVVH